MKSFLVDRLLLHQVKGIQNACFADYFLLQKQPPEVFCKKKVLLKISQISQENTTVGVSL